MGFGIEPIITMSVLSGLIVLLLPLLVRKGPNRGWATTYMHQMNPLFGPILHNTTILLMQKEWAGMYPHGIQEAGHEAVVTASH
ncbi:unnamed protein product [Notodromas monacha]|uniref:Uncharacterized protein n=1 Tax=Notodromas monacha TaxID=399045 RepID=A0A7R9BXN0_9CRUS|nr:unnamed protein product [Notodromas monacha]CAD7285708.1 unnamed protein product [Notodromas monacha]CAG0923685.1 unnamed protein product [Notodromas monacha]CAG0925860.1 unnamed protein product [Notodromas monacha]